MRKGQGKDFSLQRMNSDNIYIYNLVVENTVREHEINSIINFSNMSLERCISHIKIIEMLWNKEIIDQRKKKNKGDICGRNRDKFQILLKYLEATVHNMKGVISIMSH